MYSRELTNTLPYRPTVQRFTRGTEREARELRNAMLRDPKRYGYKPVSMVSYILGQYTFSASEVSNA